MAVRKVYAPYSTSAENVAQTPLEGYIDIKQEVRPTIQTGFVDENGLWTGNKSSDTEFIAYSISQAVANGAQILAPSVNADGTWPLDMTGYNDLIYAIKVTDAGNYETTAVMGPDSNSFANLSPVNAAATLRGTINDAGSPAISNILVDGAESLTANVWNIFYIGDRVKNQKLLQFKIVNNSGGASDMEVCFLRIVQ